MSGRSGSGVAMPIARPQNDCIWPLHPGDADFAKPLEGDQ